MQSTVKKKLLIYYYNEELSVTSTTSVTRLVASLSAALSDIFSISYFSFQTQHQPIADAATVIFLRVNFVQRFTRTVNNYFSKKRIKWFTLKRNAVKKFFFKKGNSYDAVIVLGLDDVKFVKKIIGDKKLIYWIHNISALCNKNYLADINYADFFVSPSKTTYHFLLKKLEPAPLTAEFFFMPNWVESIFSENDTELISQLKNKHGLADSDKVFIFAGSDLKLKGRFILEKALQKLQVTAAEKVTFIFAGGIRSNEDFYINNVRIIYVGLLPPQTLAAYYRLATFGCFPSLAYDHCPLALLEMINCSVIPVASNMGGIKEILGNNYSFLINEPHDVSAWVKYITMVLALSKDERNEIINTIKNSVASYKPNNAVKVIEEIMLG